MLLALAQSVSFAGSVANAWPSDSWQAQYADLHRSILNVTWPILFLWWPAATHLLWVYIDVFMT